MTRRETAVLSFSYFQCPAEKAPFCHSHIVSDPAENCLLSAAIYKDKVSRRKTDVVLLPYQSWEFALSLKIAHVKEWPWANRSCRSLKWAAVSESLLSLFKKDRRKQIAFKEQHKRFARKKSNFSHVFDSFSQFSPLFMPISESLSLLFHTYLKRDRRSSLSSLFSKERKSKLLIFVSEWLFPSFTHKKLSIR